METAGIYGLGKHLVIIAFRISAIVANRISKEFSKDGNAAVEKLIERLHWTSFARSIKIRKYDHDRILKYHGTGNDFIILDNREGRYSHLNIDEIGFLCDRRFGIGADGLMLLNTSSQVMISK